jgi:ankyrin repeat protein
MSGLQTGRTPLMVACANGHAGVLEVLLDDDYDVDATLQDHQGRLVSCSPRWLGLACLLALTFYV